MSVISLSKLFSLLPTLAVIAGVLSGVENVSGVQAHSPAVRSNNHRQLANRRHVAQMIKNSKRGTPSFGQGKILTRADGSQCRLRPDQISSAISSSSSSVAVTTSTSTSTSVWVAPTSQAVATTSSSEVGNNWYAPPSSAAAAATTAASQPSNNNGGGGNSGGWKNSGSKLLAAWPNGNWASPSDPNYIGNYIGSKTGSYYTWSPYSVPSADQLGLEFIPMLWGPHQRDDWYGQQPNWPSTVKNAVFFNEPNEPSQCNMAASDSVSYWMNDMVPLRSKGINLGGAATTSAPNGLTWVQNIIQDCKNYGNSAADCTPDFIPIHWYDTTPDNFKQYVQNFHQQTGLDIWITEYACQNFNGGAQCSTSDVWNLHQTMASWFDQQDYIKRYAPFGMMQNMQGVNQDNALMDPSGSITALGSWYIWSA